MSNSSSVTAAATTAERKLEAARVNVFLHAENVRIFNKHQERPRLPVVVVTGFLGSGKTTLLQHMLTNKQNLRLAAAVNDFASLNIDESLIRSMPSGSQASKVVELSNGCICCSLIGSLTDAVWSLLKEGGDVDLDNINYLVIETSGITDPTRIVTSLEKKFGKMYRARLDAVVTVIDADFFSQWVSPSGRSGGDTGGEVPPTVAKDSDQVEQQESTGSGKRTPNRVAVQQLRTADVILLNKMDLVSEATANAVEQLVREFAPRARILRTTRSRVPLSEVLDVEASGGQGGSGAAFGLRTKEKTQLTYQPSRVGGSLLRSDKQGLVGPKGTGSTHDHSAPGIDFQSVSLYFDHSKGPVALSGLLNLIASPLLDGLVRAKGILWVASTPSCMDGRSAKAVRTGPAESEDPLRQWRCVIHMSGRFPGRWSWELDGQWTGPAHSEIVLIGHRDTFAVQKVTAVAEMLCAPSLGIRSSTGHEMSIPVKLVKTIVTDRRFDVVEYNGKKHVGDCAILDSPPSSVFWLRLTGAKKYGFTLDQLAMNYRIDLDRVRKSPHIMDQCSRSCTAVTHRQLNTLARR